MFLSSPNPNCKRSLQKFLLARKQARANRHRENKLRSESTEKASRRQRPFSKIPVSAGSAKRIAREKAETGKHYPQLCISLVCRETTSSYLEACTGLSTDSTLPRAKFFFIGAIFFLTNVDAGPMKCCSRNFQKKEFSLARQREMHRYPELGDERISAHKAQGQGSFKRRTKK
jgi:hypothetical protein